MLLRGFDVSALVDPSADPQPLDDTDLSLMRRAGADVVRVPVTWAGLEPQPGRFDAGYVDRVAALVARCAAHGLAVVLDMHFLGWSGSYAGQSGAPAWATVPGIPDAELGLGAFGKYVSPAVNTDLAVFWLTAAWQQQLLQAWRFLAGRLRGDSDVAGYDLYNEPHPSPIPPVIFDKRFLWPFYQRAIDAIGAVDPNHLFIVEGLLLEDFGTTIVPLRAPNLVYSPHLYAGSLV
ncbi:MAG: cellulase family glycosylhydrolase, partial [Candidatus Dormibacteraeota bacterium]|nr:cellulase family glycosylhydrolase [Candidatus Dormibacteraeota bacterium]